MVGLGRWGRHLLRNFATLPGSDLRWCCDPDPGVLAQQAAPYPVARPTASFDDLLADSELEAVVLATPVPTHHALARQALEAGKHVFVEKPMTFSASEARDLRDVVQRTGGTLMVGHLLRYHPAVVKLRELIDAGELGDVRYVYGNRVNLGTIRPDENALWSLGVHDVSVVLHLLGDDPDEVSARGECYVRPNVQDVVFGYIHFATGQIGHLHLSWLDPHKMRKMTVVGSRKMAVFDDMETEGKVDGARQGRDPDARGADQHARGRHLVAADRHERAAQARVRALPERVRTGEEPRTGVDEGVRSSRCSRPCSGPWSAAARRSRSRRRRGDVDGGRGAGPRGRTDASIGAGVRFGANVTVHEGTVVGDGCTIGDNAVLGKQPVLSATSTTAGEVGRLVLGREVRVSAGAVLSAGARARRRLRRRRPCHGAGARDGRRGRCDRARRLRRERRRDRRLHEDPDERLHHRRNDARGRTSSSPPASSRPTITSWAAPNAATP